MEGKCECTCSRSGGGGGDGGDQSWWAPGCQPFADFVRGRSDLGTFASFVEYTGVLDADLGSAGGRPAVLAWVDDGWKRFGWRYGRGREGGLAPEVQLLPSPTIRRPHSRLTAPTPVADRSPPPLEEWSQDHARLLLAHHVAPRAPSLADQERFPVLLAHADTGEPIQLKVSVGATSTDIASDDTGKGGAEGLGPFCAACRPRTPQPTDLTLLPPPVFDGHGPVPDPP